MRSWLLLFLLLLSILIHEAQGIRLIKGSVPDRQHGIHKVLSGKRKNDAVEEAIMCTSRHCPGRIRKLTMTPISSTTTNIAKNDKNEEKKAHPKMEGSSTRGENLYVHSSSMNEQGQPTPEPYPGILDIAGMDYSLARRKPPVHN